MRKILFAILLAGAAAAQAYAVQTDQPVHQDKDAKAKAQPPRQGRAEGAGSRQTRPGGADRGVPNTPAGQANNGAQAVHPNAHSTVQVQGMEQNRRTIQPGIQSRPLSQPVNRLPNVERRAPPVVSSVPRLGTQPPLRTVNRTTPQVRWNTNWRNNNHYDWQNYRRHHRSTFRLGSYFDPFGWGYYPYQIGWRLWPAYYGNRYWINDPGMYRLPYAPPGYVWVRYWNDALLVDTGTGEVVDMIPNFFW